MTAFTPCTASQAPYSSHLHPLGFARHLGDRHRRFGSSSLLVRIRTSKQINTTYPLLQQIPSPLDVDSAAPVRGIQRQANKAYSHWPPGRPKPAPHFLHWGRQAGGPDAGSAPQTSSQPSSQPRRDPRAPPCHGRLSIVPTFGYCRRSSLTNFSSFLNCVQENLHLPILHNAYMRYSNATKTVWMIIFRDAGGKSFCQSAREIY